jgi:putative transposase
MDSNHARGRRSIRLPQYQYGQPGAYSITICTYARTSLFGEVVDGTVCLSRFGQIVERSWREIPDHDHHVELDAFVVMPNHVHGILVLGQCSPGKGTACRAPTERFGGPVPGSLPTILRSFKSGAARRVNCLRRTPGGRVWQRGYYERVIRNERELSAVRRYVLENPLKWELDPDNLASANKSGGRQA